MFTIDQDITVHQLREKNLMKVFFSMNNHQVATPEMMLEEARSYVMFYGEPGGKVSAYIGLYLLLTGRRLFYAHSSNPFSLGELDSVEDEALCFVEGLGALLDEIDIANLSAEKKGRWLEEQDIFSLQARPEKAPETPSPEQMETEDVQTEPQVLQPSPVVPEAAPQPRAAPQPALQAQPVPEAPQSRQALQVDVLPQAAPAVTQPPAPPMEEAPVKQEDEATPRSSAPQQNVGPKEEDQEQAVPPIADVPENRNELATRQASEETSHREIPVPAAEQTRPKPAVRASGPKAAPSAASPTGRQDIMRKAIKAGVVKPTKPSIRKEAEGDAVVVRRDREALARLLTSF